GHDAAVAVLDQPEDQQRPSLYEVARRYIATRTALGASTKHRYEQYMRSSIGPAFGMLPVDIISRVDVTEWVQLQQSGQKPYASKTIKNRLRFLSSVFEYARDE